MIRIRPDGSFCNKGAFVFEPPELQVVKHALMAERDKVERAGGDRYGLMTLDELNKFIEELGKYTV